MNNYIWCPYYQPSFMKFCSIVSKELHWQTVWWTDGQKDRTKTICLPTKVGGDINIMSLGENIEFTLKENQLSEPCYSWNLVGSKDTICSCTYYQEIWSPEFCGSYAPLNLEISRNLLLKQLVSATPLKLLNRISWNLVGSKDTICSCAYYQEMLIP
jgi:hypothetical protein